MVTNQNSSTQISDRQAYSLFLRFLASSSQSKDDNEKKKIRSYLKYAGFGLKKCSNCPKVITDERDITALMAMADEFQQRVSILDKQAAEIRRQNRISPNQSLFQNLAQLQGQKDALVDEMYFSFSRRLSNHADFELKRHINEEVKKKITIGRGGAK